MKLCDVKPGDKLVADHGFMCLRAGATVEVAADDKGTLYVPCKRGRHYLDGQLDGPAANLMGLSRPAPRRILPDLLERSGSLPILLTLWMRVTGLTAMRRPILAQQPDDRPGPFELI
ncbi:MAG TPA: hypothetical protein VGV37_07820 [Aliidongia sp.]|uniref:hypothetical protein n=1 Tax=Aliidongia sp. TaxID=1914230 RepID=UPI002DDCDFA0|nr:hypothetical protein [Aliidongia sp.]HEV2674433.1 hypothetical protein [Aliidongia sp.]